MPRLFTTGGLCYAALSLLLLGGGHEGGPLRPAAGHAVMVEPRSRPWMEYLQNYNYLPHQVFAGGTQAISQNETLRWPDMHRSGVCGDAFGKEHWSKAGPVLTNYTAGQTIDVDVIFAQNHLGRFEVRLCPLDATDEAKDCKELQRADGKGPAIFLPMTPNWHGVTSGFVAPEEEVESFKMFQMPTVGKKDGCVAWACDQFKDMWVYRSQWKLPNKVKCEHCALQFFWMTGSRCWPPCPAESKPGACIENPMEYGICGEPKTSYPELFFQCSDISIR